jgi:hypothetical protein
MRMRLGPEPCCSQYHSIPSCVLTMNVLSILKRCEGDED